MDIINSFIKSAPLPVVWHRGLSVIEASDSFRDVIDCHNINEISLEQCLPPFFKSEELLNTLIESFKRKEGFCLKVVAYKNGNKIYWKVRSFFYNEGADSGTQITWFIDESSRVVKEAYWSLQINMNHALNDIMCRDIQLKQVQSQLIQSAKMAAVGQLASGVAHEINNPVGVILGFAQVVLERIEAGSVFEMPLKSIEREAIRCKKLVQGLLEFSRIEKTVKENVDLNQLIEASIRIVFAQAKLSNVLLVKELSPDLPKIFVNANQIQQVIINLCVNALDAVPESSRLFIRTQKADLNGEEAIELQVEDMGIGIPQGIQSKIFEPFFTTKEVGKGTGLGLALVYEIVQKHAGAISFKSEEGKGTIFFIKLPVGS